MSLFKIISQFLSPKHFLFLVYLQFLLLFSQVTVFAQGDDDIINVDSLVVILNVTITDENGEPASGLTKNQFEIFENGVKQELAFFENQESPFSAVILIDTSGSMQQRVSLARSAAIQFLDKLRPDDNVAIYNFDSKVSLVQEFSNLRDLNHRAFNLEARGWTALNDAIFKSAVELQKRPEKRRAIIVLSDGADTRSEKSASKALKAALKANATVYTVDMSGVNTGGRQRMQNQGALRNFAKKSGGIFVKTPGGVQMRAAFENIVKELGVQYTVGYYPSNTKKDGKWRKIKLNVKGKHFNIRTREGYSAQKQ